MHLTITMWPVTSFLLMVTSHPLVQPFCHTLWMIDCNAFRQAAVDVRHAHLQWNRRVSMEALSRDGTDYVRVFVSEARS